MIDRIKDLLNKIPFTIVVMAIAAWIATDYYKFLKSDDSPLALKNNEFKKAEEVRDQSKKKLEEAKLFIQTFETKREEIRALFSKLSEMRNTLTEDVSKPALIELVTTEAKRSGLKVFSIVPEAPRKGEYYIEHPFKVKFRGVYVQLMLFLKRISDTKRILRADQFNLKPTGSKKFGSNIVELDGDLLISTFTYTGGKADELAQQPSGTTAPTAAPQQPAKGGK